MAALTTTITNLTTLLKDANEKLATLISRITVLDKDLATAKGKQTLPIAKTFTRTHYCHTHGPKYGHPSKECHKNASGHKDKATNAIRMAGATTLG